MSGAVSWRKVSDRHARILHEAWSAANETGISPRFHHAHTTTAGSQYFKNHSTPRILVVGNEGALRYCKEDSHPNAGLWKCPDCRAGISAKSSKDIQTYWVDKLERYAVEAAAGEIAGDEDPFSEQTTAWWRGIYLLSRAIQDRGWRLRFREEETLANVDPPSIVDARRVLRRIAWANLFRYSYVWRGKARERSDQRTAREDALNRAVCGLLATEIEALSPDYVLFLTASAPTYLIESVVGAQSRTWGDFEMLRNRSGVVAFRLQHPQGWSHADMYATARAIRQY